jgi:hypothetical protein
MARERFPELRRGQRLQDRGGRVWTLVSDPFLEAGLLQVVLRSGDLVRRVNQRFGDDQMALDFPDA